MYATGCMAAPKFPDARIRPAPFLVIAGGSVGLLVGGLAMAAWWVGPAELAGLRAGTAFNEALGLALAGAGVLMLAGDRPAVARWLGVALVGGALFTLAQPVFGVTLGVDTLFFESETHHARMPASSAAALFLAGVVLGVPARFVSLRVSVSLALIAGAVIALTGAVAGIPQAAAWGATRPMGRAAACAFLGVGVALATHAFSGLPRHGQRRRWAPHTAGLASAAAGVLFWQALVAHQDANMRRTVAAEATSQRARATERFFRLAGALQSVGYSAYAPTTSVDAWRLQTRTIVKLFPTILAVEWIAPNLTVRRIALDRDRAETVESPPLGPAERRALDAARATAQPTVVQRFALGEDQWAMRVAVPVFPRGRFEGFVTSLVRVDALLSDEADAPADFLVTITADGEPVAGAAPATDRVGDWTQRRRLPLPGPAEWALAVTPAPRLEAAINTALPEIVLAAGLLIALALAVALRLAINLERRARELSHTNRRLGLEVAQRRQAEEALQRLARELEQRVEERTHELEAANARLARSNEDLRQFGAFVAHELRQPIATAQIWADVLEEKAAGELAPAVEAPLSKLRTAIERMKGLVDKELRLATDGTQEVALDRVPLGPLLADVVGELRPRIEQAAARIELGPLPVVSADAALLRRLFVNLLENALKHPRPDVPLVIRVEAQTLPADNGVGPRHEIRVIDNGRGFAPEEAGRIFEIFARGGGSAGVEGSGLGLAICRRIAERHGGHIRAEGRPGEGATFALTLPRERDVERAAS